MQLKEMNTHGDEAASLKLHTTESMELGLEPTGNES